jgi:hypothetical protein
MACDFDEPSRPASSPVINSTLATASTGGRYRLPQDKAACFSPKEANEWQVFLRTPFEQRDRSKDASDQQSENKSRPATAWQWRADCAAGRPEMT